MIDREQGRTFLSDLYGDDFPGWLTLWFLDTRQTAWFAAGDIDALLNEATRRAGDTDVYFGVGLRRENLGPQQRGGADQVIGIPGLWLDLDVAGPEHKLQNLPASISEAERLIDAIPLAPTLLVNSGHGLHAYWHFREPWIFESSQERDDAASLVKRFQQFVISLAGRDGLTVDNTSDLARVLRLPGTVNRKSDPVPVSIVRSEPSRRYNADDFELFLAQEITRPRSPAGAYAESPGVIVEGERNVVLASWAGRLRRVGLDPPEMAAALLALNERRARPPLTVSEVTAIATSIGKRPAGWSAPVAHMFTFLDDEAMAEEAVVSWQIRNIIPERGFVEMHGPSGIGKSFLALDLAMCVATGAAWHGRPVRQGPVVYVASEQSPGGRGRYGAWKTYKGTTKPPPIFFVEQAVDLRDADAVESFLAQLPCIPSLVVFDTLARCFGNGDENSARDMGQAVRGLDAIRSATDATVLLVHHSPRDRGDERGSGALRAACDAMLQVSRTKEGTITVRSAKMRDAADFPDLHFRLESVGTSCVIVPADPTEAEVALKQQELLKVLWQYQPSTHGNWLAKSRMSKSTFNRYLKTLAKEGYVVATDGEYRVTESGSKLSSLTVPEEAHGTNGAGAKRSHQSPSLFGRDGGTEPSSTVRDWEAMLREDA